MITLKDLNDIAENKIRNEAQKTIIRSSFPPHIAEVTRDRFLSPLKSDRVGDQLNVLVG